MLNKRNIASLLSLVCAWQLDLEANEAFLLDEFPQSSQNDLAQPTAEHSTDAWEAILNELHSKKQRGSEEA